MQEEKYWVKKKRQLVLRLSSAVPLHFEQTAVEALILQLSSEIPLHFKGTGVKAQQTAEIQEWSDPTSQFSLDLPVIPKYGS